MRISDWSSDVCSSDLHESLPPEVALLLPTTAGADGLSAALATMPATGLATGLERFADRALGLFLADPFLNIAGQVSRSEEHTSELQSLKRNSYAVFCLKTKNHKLPTTLRQYNSRISL